MNIHYDFVTMNKQNHYESRIKNCVHIRYCSKFVSGVFGCLIHLEKYNCYNLKFCQKFILPVN